MSELVEALGARLGADLLSLAAEVPATLLSVDEITSRKSSRTRRGAFRLDFQGGLVLKGRRFATPASAETAKAILDAAPRSHYPSAIAQRGDALIEEWIVGEPVDPQAIDALETREIGRALGMLHVSKGVRTDVTAIRDVDSWLARTQRNVQLLVGAGALTNEQSHRILEAVAALTPAHAEIGNAHRDPRPENLIREEPSVSRSSGRLMWVDSGSLAVGAVDEDLARLWHHWPKSDVHRRAFFDGYRLERDPVSFFDNLEFWTFIVLTQSARVRLRSSAAASQHEASEILGRLLDRLEVRSHSVRAVGVQAPRSAGHVIEHGGLQIAIHSSHLRPLKWLAEFFPKRDVAAPSAFDVHLSIERERFNRLVSSGPEHDESQVDCFTLDGRFETHRIWSEDAAQRTIFHEPAELFLRIEKSRPCIEILALADSRHMRVALMRLVRELIAIRGQQRGDLLLHASAVVHDGGAILFAGPKRAGKTSMLLNALNCEDVEFLSNDRVLLCSLKEDIPIVRSLPTIVRIRPESLRYLTSPVAADWNRTHHYALSREEAMQGMEPPASGRMGRSCSMTPVQFCHWRGVQARHEAPVMAIVFPRVEASVRTFDLQAISESDASTKLDQSMFSHSVVPPIPRAFEDTWIGRGIAAEVETSNAGARRALAAAGVRFIACGIGPEAFRDANVWQALRDELGTTCRPVVQSGPKC